MDNDRSQCLIRVIIRYMKNKISNSDMIDSLMIIAMRKIST